MFLSVPLSGAPFVYDILCIFMIWKIVSNGLLSKEVTTFWSESGKISCKYLSNTSKTCVTQKCSKPFDLFRHSTHGLPYGNGQISPIHVSVMIKIKL